LQHEPVKQPSRYMPPEFARRWTTNMHSFHYPFNKHKYKAYTRLNTF